MTSPKAPASKAPGKPDRPFPTLGSRTVGRAGVGGGGDPEPRRPAAGHRRFQGPDRKAPHGAGDRHQGARPGLGRRLRLGRRDRRTEHPARDGAGHATGGRGPGPSAGPRPGGRQLPLSAALCGDPGGQGRQPVPVDRGGLDPGQDGAGSADDRDGCDLSGLRLRQPQGLQRAHPSEGSADAGSLPRAPPQLGADPGLAGSRLIELRLPL
uniref:Translation initiation factor IF-2-like n=1 Tax=Parastrongyloides trichosuri TaxID=131310 RepID=A0A0N4Z3Q6_PARTI